MAGFNSVAECEQELKRTVHTIELARIDLSLYKQETIDYELRFNELLDLANLRIVNFPNERSVRLRGHLQRTIARMRETHARHTKFLQGRLDAYLSIKNDLEKLKTIIKEIGRLKARIEEIDRYLRPLKFCLGLLDRACFLVLAIWVVLYFENIEQHPRTLKVRCLEWLGAFFLALALRTALYFSGHLRYPFEKIDQHQQNLKAHWRDCVGAFFMAIALRTALDFSGLLSHPSKEIDQHLWISKVDWRVQVGTLCMGVALRVVLHAVLP